MFNNNLKSVPTPPNKLGFTLAEVLITLVIIGVIAAITVPSLINKTNNQETVAKLKKAYSTLAQAVKLSEIDNGSTDNWDYSLSSENFYKQYLKKYVINTKEFGYVDLESLGIKYYWPNGTEIGSGYELYGGLYRFILNDGISIYFGNSYDTFRALYVDINGAKKPNKMGKDLFVFSIQKDYKFTPYGFGNSNQSFGTVANRDVLKGTNSHACAKDKYGFWCAALIMTDSWQIKSDYPI
ncbi:prepilin-type N-terminal cleavage/methylation domain-containing protein [bacterium]|nr:prepilin-type N-terminal cleavage/methylation domain-containing protein [bacterium]